MFGQKPLLFVADDGGPRLGIVPEALWLWDFSFLQGALVGDFRGRPISLPRCQPEVVMWIYPEYYTTHRHF